MANTRITSSIKLAAFGAFAFAAQVACSDDPVQQPFTPNNTSGAGNTAGTPSTGGTFGTAGTPSNTSGTGFGTAGTPATAGAGGSTGGSAAGGTAGTGTAGTGTAGTGIVPQEPFCMGKTLEPLPYIVTSGFKQAGWSPSAVMQIKAGAQITPNPPDNCTVRLPGAQGDCSVWRYTPDPTTPSAAWVEWILQWDPGYAHPPVCIAEGATKLIFHAKGTAGGEVVSFGAPGVAEDMEVTLTADWKRYEIELGEYNSFQSGVTKGFAIKIVPDATTPAVAEFYVDNILIVKDLPPDPAGGGEGGAGSGGAGAD